jgi:hypothetical protein
VTTKFRLFLPITGREIKLLDVTATRVTGRPTSPASIGTSTKKAAAASVAETTTRAASNDDGRSQPSLDRQVCAALL